jgi:uncharacterized BrkB/YihY/UPF0761 family membrane protein
MATAAAHADLGRSADKPSEIPPQGWFAIAKRTWTEVQKDNVGIVAAGVAFYFFLALVPLLAAAVLTTGCSPSLPLSTAGAGPDQLPSPASGQADRRAAHELSSTPPAARRALACLSLLESPSLVHAMRRARS